MHIPELASLKGARVLITGGAGFLGSRVSAILSEHGAETLSVSRRTGHDLTDPAGASRAFSWKPDIVVHLAALCGGIGANRSRPAHFFLANMQMGMSVISECAASSARLVMVGTICSYPKDCPVPFLESALWDGYPEPTNAPYGVAKKALLVMCQAYRAQLGLRFGYLMPCNLYGPGDNFSEDSSHVLPALIRRFHEAAERSDPAVVCWGTGTATRSFLHVDDCARGVVLAAAGLDDDLPVNLPGSDEISIGEIATIVAREVGYRGRIEWDPSKPDGQPRRAVDGARAITLLGWRPEIGLDQGIRETVSWWHSTSARKVLA